MEIPAISNYNPDCKQLRNIILHFQQTKSDTIFYWIKAIIL